MKVKNLFLIYVVSIISVGSFQVVNASWFSPTGHYCTPDRSLPTYDQLNIVTYIPMGKTGKENSSDNQALAILNRSKINNMLVINGTNYYVQQGIPTDLNDLNYPISIRCGGYSNAGKPYSYCGFNAIKAGLVPGICITYDFPTDTRAKFNFCQAQDLHCTKLVLDKILEYNPKASIILHGSCKGAANNFRFLAEQAENGDKEHYLQNIKRVIAESPPISVQKALQHTPLSPVTLFLMRCFFPNFNQKAKTIMQATKFPSTPVMIASLPQDTVSKLDDMERLQCYLNSELSGTVQLFVSKNKENVIHGKIGRTADYRREVKKFLSSFFTQENNKTD